MLGKKNAILGGLSVAMATIFLTAAPVLAAASVALKQSIAESIGSDSAVAQFYKSTNYEPLWVGRERDDRSRRAALADALASAGDHGLPAAAYDLQLITRDLNRVKSERELGQLEVAITKLFLDYARDVQTGYLTPSAVDNEIARKVPLRDPAQVLSAFAKSTPAAFMRALPPQTEEYRRLMKHKFVLEDVIARGGWGATVPDGKYEQGDTGNGVIALRNRLIAMGYMQRTARTSFDVNMQKAVQAFQRAHGLNADGVAGAGTIRAINVSPIQRLGSVIVAMERERWTNMPRGERHIWVNIADFSAAIMDNGKVTFKTRAVVGAARFDHRSPEFSDKMEYMVINPSWFVPYSITVKEYLPMLQEDPTAVSHLDLIDDAGRVLGRQGLDFTQFNETNFPFNLKEPPSQGNALGLVKFMFPNRYNIYLHDTPAKSLFGRDTRAFSHGCIRLHQPFDFAYAILAKQTSDPKGLFDRYLSTGQESTLNLEQDIPVHLVYRTAFTDARGNVHFRGDVYGRDKKIMDALVRAGVVIPGLRS